MQIGSTRAYSHGQCLASVNYGELRDIVVREGNMGAKWNCREARKMINISRENVYQHTKQERGVGTKGISTPAAIFIYSTMGSSRSYEHLSRINPVQCN